MIDDAERTAQRRAAQAVTGIRDAGDQIDLIANSLLIDRKRSHLTKWERDFIVPVIDRWNKFQERTRLSAKQIEIIATIHEKIKNRVVI